MQTLFECGDEAYIVTDAIDGVFVPLEMRKIKLLGKL